MITSYLKGSPFIIYKIPGILGQHHTSNVFGKLRYVLGITILIFNTTIFMVKQKRHVYFRFLFVDLTLRTNKTSSLKMI